MTPHRVLICTVSLAALVVVLVSAEVVGLAQSRPTESSVSRSSRLARTPPMGWRSWNGLGMEVNQSVIIAQMFALVERRHEIDGKPTSLFDLGYHSIGLDDGWCQCVNGTFHDSQGNPMVNTTRFPSLYDMTSMGHKLGLSVGWYMNPCSCNEGQRTPHIANDVAALVKYGFDGVKVDACGPSSNMTVWHQELAASGRPMTASVENCRNYEDVPGIEEGECPFDMYRSTEDNSPDWLSLMNNLQTNARLPGTNGDPHGGLPLAHPGCYSYPDMIEVQSGQCNQNIHTCNQKQTWRRTGGLTLNESQAHVAAWAIVSSPLILGHLLSDNATYDAAWPVISNPDMIRINQAWAGDIGRQVATSPSVLTGLQAYHGRACECIVENVSLPEWTVWGKVTGADARGGHDATPMEVAALVINVGNRTIPHGEVSVPIAHLLGSSFPEPLNAAWSEYDVWRREQTKTVLSPGQPWVPPSLAPRSAFFVLLQQMSN